MRVLGLQLYPRHSPLGLRFLSLKMGRSASALPTLVGRGTCCTLRRGWQGERDPLSLRDPLVWGGHVSKAASAAPRGQLREALSFLQPFLVAETLD